VLSVRKVLLLSVCGLVFNVAVLAALYVPSASYAHAIFWLPFIPAFLTLGSALFVLNGRRLGRVGWDRLWDTLVVLPIWAKAGLGLLFVATLASTLISQVGTKRRTTGWPRSSATPRGTRTWSPRTPTTRRSSSTSTPATPRFKPRPAPP
jgi:hypothetical protein